MRQDPIEIAMVGATTRRRPMDRTRKAGRADLTAEPRIIDEAFASFDAVDSENWRGLSPSCPSERPWRQFTQQNGDCPPLSGTFRTDSDSGDRRMMRQTLVTDLAAQLAALDRQRNRLAQLLKSVESNSIAD